MQRAKKKEGVSRAALRIGIRPDGEIRIAVNLKGDQAAAQILRKAILKMAEDLGAADDSKLARMAARIARCN